MKKISRILTLLLALVLAVSCAGAEMATWQAVGTKVAPLEKEYGIFSKWDLKTKMQLIQMLEDLGELYDIDEVGTLLGEESEFLTDEQREDLCNAIMAKFVGGRVEAIDLNAILETLHGKISSWTMRDRKWYTDLRAQNGIDSDGEKNFVLPKDGELSQEKATERALNFLASVGVSYVDRCTIDATLSEEPEDVYDEGFRVGIQGRRLWTIIFDPETDENDTSGAGICKVLMLASGPIIEYNTPELDKMYMTGLLPAANGVTKEEVRETAREAIAEKLDVRPESLDNLQTYFGYISSKDEVVSHAPFRAQLWAVLYAPENIYAMLDAEGKMYYIQRLAK